jgi:hypothetical protein
MHPSLSHVSSKDDDNLFHIYVRMLKSVVLAFQDDDNGLIRQERAGIVHPPLLSNAAG